MLEKQRLLFYTWLMRNIEASIIENTVYRLAAEACTSLTPDCVKFMANARAKEVDKNAVFAFDTLICNAELAKSRHIPVCQDTGVAVVFCDIGQEVHVQGCLQDAINEGVRRAYRDGGFRASVLDPITRVNTGDNTPAIIHFEIVEGDSVKIAFLPKGFGSENMSRLYMLTPSAGIDGVKNCIIEAIRLADSNPCPPIVVGVGIGGTSEKALELAKRQLLRSLDDVNEDEGLRALENELLVKVNALGIGAQGFGGATTAYAVKIGKMPTHISALPVAINIQCNAVRVAKAEV